MSSYDKDIKVWAGACFIVLLPALFIIIAVS